MNPLDLKVTTLPFVIIEKLLVKFDSVRKILIYKQQVV